MKINHTIFTALFIVALGVISCSKSEKGVFPSSENKLTEQEALEDFAVILSKAVTDNEEMRLFLKEEALKEFDRDNDVFYPYVKNHVFSSGKTFQQELAAYEGYENQLNDIEISVPKLTILVPDFAWVDSNCFSVRNWDTSSENLCVGYDDRENEHSLFYKGELMGRLPSSSFPSFPVLIVKSNERMCVTSTKGGEIEYSFADPAFDGSCFTKAMWGYDEGYWYNDPQTEDEKNNRVSNKDDLFSSIGNFIAEDEIMSISPSAVEAFNEFSTGTDEGAVQRDYVYYGMTKQNSTNGRLNKNMRDMLYRFRFSLDGLFKISDDYVIKDNNQEDPNIGNPLNTTRGDRPGFIEAVNRMWGNGRYEIQMSLFSNGVEHLPNILSIAPEDVMYVEKLFHTFQWNVFGNNWSSYTIKQEDIQLKWYYPGDLPNPLICFKTGWDLTKEMGNVFIKVKENDPVGSETHNETMTFKKGSELLFDFSQQGDDSSVNVPFKIGYGFDDVNTTVVNITYTIPTGPDDLGLGEVNYSDNYITAKTTLNGETGYQLKTFGNSYFSASFLPIDMRNEYEITQFLLGRKSRNRN